jgi:predicted N-acetyltransferase YhbS
LIVDRRIQVMGAEGPGVRSFFAMADFTIRMVEPGDESEIGVLLSQVPDGGRVAFAPRYRVPVLQTLSDNLAGFLARSPAGEVIGTAWIRYGHCRLDGRERTYGLLNTLSVHPAYRRRGVARALTQARLAALSEHDASALAMAMIQLGNRASVANAATWSTVSSNPLRVVAVPSPRRQSRLTPRPGWEVMELDPAGASASVPDLLNHQPRGLGPSAETLDECLAREVAGRRINYGYALIDQHGSALAALAVQDDTPLFDLVVSRMPRSVAAANRFVRVVGPDGTMRTAQAVLAVGETQAGRYLWQQVRWSWRHRVTSIVTTTDPAGPEHALLNAPRWLPATAMTLALRLPADEHLTGPIQMPL